jgi:hypothetical protein
MLDHVRAALIRGGGSDRVLLAELNRGEWLLCWTDAWLALRASGVPGCYKLATLADALRWQAEDYDRESLSISARDCYWLAAKLTGGALQLATRARVDEAREAQAAQRRGCDLDRWQQLAEARIAAR